MSRAMSKLGELWERLLFMPNVALERRTVIVFLIVINLGSVCALQSTPISRR